MKPGESRTRPFIKDGTLDASGREFTNTSNANRVLYFVVLFLATPLAYGQRITSFPAAKAACGPESLKFDVSPDAGEPAIVSKASGKALVYVIEDVRKGALLRMTTRFGVDGAWVGANQGASHFSFLVDPGDHHLCVNGQWTRLTGEPSIALLHLAARAGEIYYLRVRFLPPRNHGTLGLDAVDEDEGKFLIQTTTQVTSRPK